MSLKQKIEELRNKPYRERIKLLWTLVAFSVIILVIIWFAAIKLRQAPDDTRLDDKVQNVIDEIKNVY